MVAAGTAALLAATQATFRSFGPSLAISVLAGLVVSVTFIPAAMATFGRALYWPRGLRASAPDDAGRPGWLTRQRERIAHLATHRAAALGTVVVCVALLLVAASGLRWIGLGLDFISGLPSSSEPQAGRPGGHGRLRPGHPLPHRGPPAEARRRDADGAAHRTGGGHREAAGRRRRRGPAGAAAGPAHPVRRGARHERGAVLRGVLHRPPRQQRHRHARVPAGGDARPRARGRAHGRARRLRG